MDACQIKNGVLVKVFYMPTRDIDAIRGFFKF